MREPSNAASQAFAMAINYFSEKLSRFIFPLRF